MRKAVGFFVLALVLGVSASAQGFGITSGPGGRIYADFKPVIGAWAEYLLTAKGEEPVTLRFAVVGQEGQAFWYEIRTSMGDEGDAITKMLVSGDPQDPQSVTRMIVKAGAQPAMELPVTPPGEDEVTEAPEGKVEELGVESVAVPAGTFEARHIRVTQDETVGDVWLVEGIGPYGMVKSTAEGLEMVLTAHGTDAKSLITETPVPFGIQGMFGMPKGQ